MLRDRCEEILRLIDDALNGVPAPVAVARVDAPRRPASPLRPGPSEDTDGSR